MFSYWLRYVGVPVFQFLLLLLLLLLLFVFNYFGTLPALVNIYEKEGVGMSESTL
jgi:hypothetical protein